MRVYGFHPEDMLGAPMKSTATYTRLPVGTNEAYRNVARGADTELPVTTTGNTTYRVVSGDNLTRIVRDFLQTQGKDAGSAAVYDGVRKVAQSNGLANANLIHPGQDLNLSVLLDRVSAATGATRPAELQPEPLAALQIRPAAITSTVLPSDPLRSTNLTATTAPFKVSAMALPERPVEAKQPIVTATPLADDEGANMDHMGGTVHNANALQRLLNGTADALALVRKIMDHDGDVKAGATVENPWDPVLNGAARISSNYGMRKDPFTGRMAFHDGIDLAAKRGTEITALRDGEVVYSGWKGGYGNTVVVRHADGLESVYGHTSRNLVAVGDTVKGGTVIAEVGSTGRSTGPHLHLEMRRHGKPVNPLPHLEDTPIQLAQNKSGS